MVFFLRYLTPVHSFRFLRKLQSCHLSSHLAEVLILLICIDIVFQFNNGVVVSETDDPYISYDTHNNVLPYVLSSTMSY
jgi:hypothetical protein